MVVEKRGKKWCTIHCTGTDKGKPITCFDTEKEADDQHAAIMASKNHLNVKKLFS